MASLPEKRGRYRFSVLQTVRKTAAESSTSPYVSISQTESANRCPLPVDGHPHGNRTGTNAQQDHSPAGATSRIALAVGKDAWGPLTSII